MTKDCKCTTLEELERYVDRFVAEYQFALCEEFISGDEVTVLACADSTQPAGRPCAAARHGRLPRGRGPSSTLD